MTNVLNNYFKEKHLNLKKDPKLIPINLKLKQSKNNSLKDKVKTLYNFSYNKQWEGEEKKKLLNLSSLSRKGYNLLHISPKAKSFFLYKFCADAEGKGKNFTHLPFKNSNYALKREFYSSISTFSPKERGKSTLLLTKINQNFCADAEGKGKNFTFFKYTSLVKLITLKNLYQPFKGYSYFSFSSVLPKKERDTKLRATPINIWDNSLSPLKKNREMENISTFTSNKYPSKEKEQDFIAYNPILTRRVQRSPKGLRFLENKENKHITKKMLESSVSPKVEQLVLKYWKKRWLKKKKQYSELSTYNYQVSDKEWGFRLEKIRQNIKSKYAFNTFLASSQLVNYTFNKNLKENLLLHTSIYKIFKYFFSSLSALISKPIFSVSPNKVNIQLFYYIIPPFSKLKRERNIKNVIKYKGKLSEEKKNNRELTKIMANFKLKAFISKWKENSSKKILKISTLSDSFFNNNNFSLIKNEHSKLKFDKKNLKNNSITLEQTNNRDISTMISLNINKFKYFVFILEKFFKKTVILDLIKLKYPYHNSNILAQILGLSSKRKNFRLMLRTLIYTATIKNPKKLIRKQNFSIIPSYLSGIKIKLAGRLISQRVVPRFTVQNFQMGSLARGKINYVDSSRFTHKNKRGAFSFTVTTGHMF